MSNTRTCYTAILCCDCPQPSLRDAGRDIIAHLGRRFGGATLTACNGTWAEDGNDTKTAYAGVHIENGVKIGLTVPESDREDGYQELTQAISEAVARHELPARFVHVDCTQVRAMHFEVGAGQSFVATNAV